MRVLLFVFAVLGAFVVHADEYRCRGTEQLTNRTGTITDHTGAGNYLDKQFCVWNIVPSASGVTAITFEFSYIDLEYYYDIVAIYNGLSIRTESLVVWFTGQLQPEPVVVAGSNATVLFLTDDFVTATGFQLKYYADSCPNRCSGHGDCILGTQCQCYPGYYSSDCSLTYCNETSCNPSIAQCIDGECYCKNGLYGLDCDDPFCVPKIILVEPSGTITSNANGGEYLSPTNCTWEIRGPSGSSITVWFSKFDLEDGYDFLTMLPGASSEHILGRFTGSKLPPPVVSTDGSMYLVFSTDVGVARTGFVAHYYVSTCSPACVNGTCINGTCLCDIGFTGPACDQTECALNCTGRGTCNEASQQCECDPGFTAPDCGTCVDVAACPLQPCQGASYLTNSTGRLSDHEGLGNYAAESQCQWTIDLSGTADPPDSIALAFDSFDLEYNQAFVDVLDREGYMVASLTGSDDPSVVVVQGPMMSIEFHSSQSTDVRTGFVAYYSASFCPSSCSQHGSCILGRCLCDIGFTGLSCNATECVGNCNGHGNCVSDRCVCDTGYFGPDCSVAHCEGEKHITSSHGLISDHAEGQAYLPNSLCRWVITPPANSSAEWFSLAFTAFQTEFGYDYVSVYGGPLPNPPLLGNFAGPLLPPALQIPLPQNAPDTAGFIVTFSSDDEVELTGFQAYYSTGEECAGLCSGNQGFCVQGTCHCQPGWTGTSCSERVDFPLLPLGQVVTDTVGLYEWKVYSLLVDRPIYAFNVTARRTAPTGNVPHLFLQYGSTPSWTAYNLTNLSLYALKTLSVRMPEVGTWYIGVYGGDMSSGTTTNYELQANFVCPQCQHGGVCVNYQCQCPRCATGPLCETACSGHGECSADGGCNCYSYYSGDLCNSTISTKDDDSSSPSRRLSLAGAVLLAVVILVFAVGAIVAAVIIIIRARRARRQPESPTPPPPQEFTDISKPAVPTKVTTDYTKFEDEQL